MGAQVFFPGLESWYPSCVDSFPAACLAMSRCGLCLLLACLLGLCLRQAAFLLQPGSGGAAGLPESGSRTGAQPLSERLEGLAAGESSSAWDASLRVLLGGALSAVLLLGAAPARADVEDVVIAVDEKGKTTSLTKEGVVRGKRLFNAACAICHIGGGTKTNQNV